MKKITVVILVLSVVLLTSCMRQVVLLYHSEAELPYFHFSSKTTFKLMNDKELDNYFEFGVVAAKDNDTLNYVLLVPAIGSVNELTDVRLNNAVTLLPAQVNDFIKILDKSVKNWDEEYDKITGISYEYSVAPENLIVKESENVKVWYPTLKYYYQNDKKGAMGTIIMGEGFYKYVYFFNKKSKLTDLMNMLEKGLKQ